MGSNYTFFIPIVSITGADILPASPVPIPSAGIWLINYQIRIQPISIGTVERFFTEVYVGGVQAGGTIEDVSTQNLTTQKFMSHSGTTIVTINNSTTTVYINTVVGIVAGPLQLDNRSFIKFMRIA